MTVTYSTIVSQVKMESVPKIILMVILEFRYYRFYFDQVE